MEITIKEALAFDDVLLEPAYHRGRTS